MSNDHDVSGRAKPGQRPHPNKPLTPEQIAAFVKLWHDPSITQEGLAAKYEVAPPTVRAWAKMLGLAGRAKVKDIASSAKAMAIAEASAMNPQVISQREMNKYDPKADVEVAKLIAECLDHVRGIGAGTSLTAYRRALMKLEGMVALKTPIASWATLGIMASSLASQALAAERIEAQLPKGDGDKSQLRKDVAHQLMREVAESLPPEKQKMLAALVKEGAEENNRRQALRKQGQQGGEVAS
jgi:hypothetical protein